MLRLITLALAFVALSMRASAGETPSSQKATQPTGVGAAGAKGTSKVTKPPALRGLYDKPFTGSLWNRAHVGGYMELEYHDFDDGVLGMPQGFRAHRTNIFIYYEDDSGRIRFVSEIEFENEEPGDDLEIKVEAAFLDWVLTREFSLRGGVILAPVGRMNVNHDGPTRELVDRPLVSTFVIPTTLSEAGVGAFGTIEAGDRLSISYEVYAVGGFQLLDQFGGLATPVSERDLLREGRASLGGDNNDRLATTGRVALEIADRLSVGVSWHVGEYDELGNNRLNIYALDLAFVTKIKPLGAELSLEGEYAIADFARDALAMTAGIPDQYDGYYFQAALTFKPRWMKRIGVDETASITFAVRFDSVDIDGDKAEAIEPGISLRPRADTVIKLSYRFSQDRLGLAGTPQRPFDDEGLVFGIATYF